MYIQITNRCNMLCKHCCYSCTTKGKDMTRETFIKALQLCEEFNDYPFLGGGEPTLHPFLFDFIGLACTVDHEFHVGLVTNGKLKEPAIKLARMAEKGIIQARLSQDQYHEPIDPETVKAFTKNKKSYEYGHNEKDNDLREIGGYIGEPYGIGRAKQFTDRKGCVCPELHIEPDGKIFACGCRKLQFGTLDNPDIPDYYYDWDERCSEAKENKKSRKLMKILA